MALKRLRRKAWKLEPGSRIRHAGLKVRINDGPNFYTLYKDIFVYPVYHFEARRPDPLILDCGSNIGMSILYFKRVYPRARILGFEPDPAIYPYLQENVGANAAEETQLIQAAIAGKEGTLVFYSDGKYGSCLAEHLPSNIPEGWTKHEVPCVRLRDYLTEPVDFLKMNIEGAEYEALADSADRLSMIREMVVEYHHLPGLPRTLHKILTLLHEAGFEYVVSDLNADSYGNPRPPVALKADSRYFRHLYACRLE